MRMSTTTRSGLVLADQVFQFGTVGGLGDDLVAGTGKDPGDTLAQEDIVIRYDHPPAGHFGGMMQARGRSTQAGRGAGSTPARGHARRAAGVAG